MISPGLRLLLPPILGAVLGSALPSLAAARQPRQGAVQQAPSTRRLEWLTAPEFQRLVPKKIDTVLLTLDALDRSAPFASAADPTPLAIANALAEDIGALIAPHRAYGPTGASLGVPPSPSGPSPMSDEAFRAYVRAVLDGLVQTGFRKIILLNGHAGPQTPLLEAVARDLALERHVLVLVVQWDPDAGAVTPALGDTGERAGSGETAFIQANPTGPVPMAPRDASPAAWSALPFPSSITLYKPGSGWPKGASQRKAEKYFRRVIERVRGLIQDTIATAK